MKKYKVLELTWEDHHLGMTEDPRLIMQRSIGYFVTENDDVIVIAMSVDEFGKFDEKLTIGKKMLVKRKSRGIFAM